MKMAINLDEDKLRDIVEEAIYGLINRQDKNGTPIYVNDVLLNDNGKEYKVVFSEDILAFGIVDESNMFDFMSEWVSGEWEIIK